MALRSSDESRASSPAMRLRIALQVTAMIVVAAACAALAAWLSARPGLVWRADLTASGRNSIDPGLADIVAKLPRAVRIETFLRPLDAPMDRISSEVNGRINEFLFVLAASAPDKVEVLRYDPNDVATTTPRMKELDIDEAQLVVVSSGDKHEVLRVYRDIAQIDASTPDPRQWELATFRVDEAIASAMKSVSVGETRKLYFTTGHGERELYKNGEGNLAKLWKALEHDGLRCGWWESSRDVEVPKDCTALAIVDPAQSFSEEEFVAIERFARRGGRFLVCPSRRDAVLDAPRGAAAFLREFGIDTFLGLVAQPIHDASGREVTGNAACSTLVIMADGMDSKSPITETLWRASRRLVVPGTRGFSRGKSLPKNASYTEILRAARNAWLDRPDANGFHDWTFETGTEEPGAIPVCCAVSFTPEGLADDAAEIHSARILALGSADALSDAFFDQNADFALNAFNWLAQREWRMSIAPHTDEPRVLDVHNSSGVATIRNVALLALPLACALLGIFMFVRRRS